MIQRKHFFMFNVWEVGLWWWDNQHHKRSILSSLPKDDFSKCYDCTWGPLKSLFLEFRCTSLVWIEFLQKSVRVVILKSKRSEDLNQGILDLTRRKFGCLLSNSRRFSKTQIHAYKFFQKKTLKSYFLRQGQVDKGL